MVPELQGDGGSGAAVQETSPALVLCGVSILPSPLFSHSLRLSSGLGGTSQPGTETLRIFTGLSRSTWRTALTAMSTSTHRLQLMSVSRRTSLGFCQVLLVEGVSPAQVLRIVKQSRKPVRDFEKVYQ